MARVVGIGHQNFEQLIQAGCFYIDKTGFIREWWENQDVVTLITRPRRFGKTLNLSMLRYFFEDTGDEERNGQNRALFQGLKIMETDGGYTEQMGRYPVINLTLKSAKQPTFASAHRKLKREISEEFMRHRYVLESDKLGR